MSPWVLVAVIVVTFLGYALGREGALRRARRLAAANAAEADAERAEADRLREAQEARADAIASVTHELKTPLTSFLGYATILRKRDDTLVPEQRREFLGLMERQGQKILRLIEELLQSSRVEADLTKLRRVPVDLSAIVRQVARELGSGRIRAIAVETPEEDLGLFGDPAALEHVVTNLIDNAIKYSPDESVVSVVVGEGDGEVFLTVSDEGQGIAADDLPFIFERYRQASNARGGGSVGLGLFVVRNLIDAHGGRVWADSQPGKGTTFTVVLPRRRR